MNMGLLIQQLVNGIISGSVYALMGVGLVLIYGIGGYPDFVQGAYYMISGYVSFFLIVLLGADWIVSVLASMAIVPILALLLQMFIFRRLREKDPMTTFVASMAVYFTLEGIGLIIWSPFPRSVPCPYVSIWISMFGIHLTAQRLIVLVAAIMAFTCLRLFIKRTKIGKAIRAASEDMKVARLLGVNIDKVYITTFLLSTSLTAAAGTLISPIYTIQPHMGFIPLIKAFVVILLGGLGSSIGAIVGGMTLGIIEALGGHFISLYYQNAFAFFILITVLALKPSGLFGTKESREA